VVVLVVLMVLVVVRRRHGKLLVLVVVRLVLVVFGRRHQERGTVAGLLLVVADEELRLLRLRLRQELHVVVVLLLVLLVLPLRRAVVEDRKGLVLTRLVRCSSGGVAGIVVEVVLVENGDVSRGPGRSLQLVNAEPTRGRRLSGRRGDERRRGWQSYLLRRRKQRHRHRARFARVRRRRLRVLGPRARGFLRARTHRFPARAVFVVPAAPLAWLLRLLPVAE
jgi:hypothetical protein